MKIVKVAYHLPTRIVKNQELKEIFPHWDAHKTESKIGIAQRHVAAQDQTAVDLGEQAAQKVLEGFEKSKIDFVLFCTQSPDYFLPTSACILQNRLGLGTHVGALDFNLGCSGYVYGLSLAKGLIASGTASHVLLIVADTYTKHIHQKDIANRAIFGDAGAATIISEGSQDGLGQFVLGSDGTGKDQLIVKNGGFRHPLDPNAPEKTYGSANTYTNNHLYMDGPEIFNFTIQNVPDLVSQTLTKNATTLEEVDFFIFHQANAYMLNYLRRKSKIPKEKFFVDLSDTGNTVSATIPIAIQKSLQKGLIKTGDKVMLVGFGVGYSWGGTIVTI